MFIFSMEKYLIMGLQVMLAPEKEVQREYIE